MPPFTKEEKAHAAELQKLRLTCGTEAYDDAQRQGFHPLPSDPTTPESWMAEVILTPMGHFMVRSDVFELARALSSRPLFRETLLTDEHWGGIDPEPLCEIAPQYETLRPGHRGPRHDRPEPPPWEGEDNFDTYATTGRRRHGGTYQHRKEAA